jgi:hypothetical protein
MPAATPAAVRKQIAQRKTDPVYLIIGDDDVEIARLASDLTAVVDEELRAFNTERIYAQEKGVAASIVQSSRTLPMLGDRRVVVVLRGERLLAKAPRHGGRRRGRVWRGRGRPPSADAETEAHEETGRRLWHRRVR